MPIAITPVQEKIVMLRKLNPNNNKPTIILVILDQFLSFIYFIKSISRAKIKKPFVDFEFLLIIASKATVFLGFKTCISNVQVHLSIQNNLPYPKVTIMRPPSAGPIEKP